MEFILSPETISHALLHFEVSVGLWLLVIAAILVDLWDGIYTAKKTGQRIHSHKLRVTIDKISEYWRLLLIGFIIDTIGILFPFYTLPFLSILFAVGLIGVEGKSMWEHITERKSKAQDLKQILAMIVDCASEKDAHDVLLKVSEHLKDDKK